LPTGVSTEIKININSLCCGGAGSVVADSVLWTDRRWELLINAEMNRKSEIEGLKKKV